MATKLWRGTGLNQWGLAANWSPSGVPTSADDIIFDAVSPACTVSVGGLGLSIDFTNYANTITMSSPITISGNITLGTGMTISGVNPINAAGATGNITSNGKTIPYLTFTATSTYTLIDDLTVGTLLNVTGTPTINGVGRKINISTNFTHASSVAVSGTATFNFNGTGTWNHTTTGILRNNVTINTAGTLTINNVNYNTGTITYTAGTINATGLLNIAAATTLDTAGMVGTNAWNNITVTGNTTLTTNDLYTKGLLTLGLSANAVVINATSGIKTLTSAGGITVGINSGTVTCNMNIKITSGTIRGNSTTGWLSTPGYTFEVDGNATFSNIGLFYLYGGPLANGIFKYTSGIVTTTGSTVLMVNMIINSSTIVWGNLNLTGTSTITLLTDLSVSELLTLGSTSTTTTINSSGGTRTITAAGGITTGVTSGSVACNANIKATGGTLRGNPSNAGLISLNGYTFEIDGNVTLSNTGYFYLYGGASSTGIFKWTSGVVISTGSLIQFNAMVIDSAGMVFDRVTILNGSGQTTTLTTNLTTTGVVTLGNGTITQTINGSTLTAGGGVTLSGTSTIILGTTILRVSGGSIASVSAVQLRLNLELAGNVNFSTSLFYNTGSLTYISGTITFLPGVTLTSSTSLTFNTNGMTWNNITFTTTSSTLTLLSNFQMSGLLNTSGTFTFVGAFDANLGSITTTIAGSIITLVSGRTYNLSGAIILTGTLGSPIQLKSSSAGSVAYFNSVNNGTSTRDVGFVTTADIDSSGGLTIYDYKGIITNNTTNWAVLPTDVRTLSYGYVS